MYTDVRVWRVKAPRIKEMITILKKLLLVKQILHFSSLEMYREQYGEYAYWC